MPTVSLITEQPMPVVLVELPPDADPAVPDVDEVAVFKHVDRGREPLTLLGLLGSWFRGTSADRLDVVLATGLDVDPATAPFFAGCFNRALGHGDWPKLILALDRAALDRTFRRVPADLAEDDLAALRRTFPTVLQPLPGGDLWLSRLPADSGSVGTVFEAEYAFWRPDPARRALRALFVVTHPAFGGRAAAEPLLARLGAADAA